MTIFATDPADTGELHFADEVAETAVIRRDVGEQTVVMRPFLAVAPVSPLPRYDTGEYELPPRVGVVFPDTTLDLMPPLPGDPPPLPPSPPPHPPVPPPAVPSWTTSASGWPTVPQRPKGRYVGRRRAPVPLWALLLAGLGSGVVGGALQNWVLAALAVLGVTR
jgi:hypothetical protein